MDFDEYQEKARTTAIYGGVGEFNGLAYVALGLAGEAGEFANKVKKIWRDQGGKITQENKDILIQELGDILWYLSNAASELDKSLGEAAENNIQKLFSRKDRGVLGGSGDNR